MHDYFVEWWSRTLIPAATVLTVGLGGDENAVNQRTVGKAHALPRLRFGLLADQDVTLTVQVGLDGVAFVDQVTLVVLAGTWADGYSLPAAYGGNGFLWLAGPFVQLTIENATAVALTSLYFWAQATGV